MRGGKVMNCKKGPNKKLLQRAISNMLLVLVSVDPTKTTTTVRAEITPSYIEKTNFDVIFDVT
eukprot:3385679-Amphidinium_carterae.1